MDTATFDEFGAQGGSVCAQLVVSYWQDISTGQLMAYTIVNDLVLYIQFFWQL